METVWIALSQRERDRKVQQKRLTQVAASERPKVSDRINPCAREVYCSCWIAEFRILKNQIRVAARASGRGKLDGANDPPCIISARCTTLSSPSFFEQHLPRLAGPVHATEKPAEMPC